MEAMSPDDMPHLKHKAKGRCPQGNKFMLSTGGIKFMIKRVATLASILLCIIMLFGLVPDKAYAAGNNDPVIEDIIVNYLIDDRYAGSAFETIHVYYRNGRVCEFGTLASAGVNRLDTGALVLRVSDIPNIVVRIADDGTGQVLATIPLSQFTQFGAGHFVYELSEVANPHCDRTRGGHNNNPSDPFNTLHVGKLVLGVRPDLGGYTWFSVDGIEIALYHNNQRLRTGTTAADATLSFENLNLTVGDIENMELRIISGTGYTHFHNIMPVRYAQRAGTGARSITSWFSTVQSGASGQPQPSPTPPSNDPGLRFVIGQTTFANNGVAGTLDAAPFIQNDRTMVPLGVIVQALGATNVSFVNATQVVSFTVDGVDFALTIGEALPGGMGTPVLLQSRTFVPLAYISLAIGAQVRWDSANRAAYVYI